MTDEPDLATWLLEQIAEDEYAAEQEPDPEPMSELLVEMPDGRPVYAHVTRWSKARVQAETDAKRRIITSSEGLRYDEAHELADRVLRLLVLPYADRPGYRVEWKP